MKKGIGTVIILLVILFSYEYQKPILTSRQAAKKAVECLQHLEPFHMKSVNISINDISYYETNLETSSGFFNNLTNKRQWNVLLKIKHHKPTVTLNAYNGKCIGVTGPLN